MPAIARQDQYSLQYTGHTKEYEVVPASICCFLIAASPCLALSSLPGLKTTGSREIEAAAAAELEADESNRFAYRDRPARRGGPPGAEFDMVQVVIEIFRMLEG